MAQTTFGTYWEAEVCGQYSGSRYEEKRVLKTFYAFHFDAMYFFWMIWELV